MRTGGWFIAALTALLMWGLWGFFAKLATNHINSKSVLVFTTLGSLLVTLLVLGTLNFRPEMEARGIAFATLSGLAGTVATVSFLYAITKGRTSVVVTMSALYPLVTILLTFFILKEQITLRQGLGIVFALIAMVLFST